ncbi:MAG: PQQ-binding-like beta-propeller repeat protein [Pseudonocardia sp.]
MSEEPTRWWALLWAGIGVVTAGVGVMTWALLVVEDAYGSLGESRHVGSQPEFTVIVALTAAGVATWVALVSWRMSTGRARTPSPRWLVGLGMAVLVVSLLSILHWAGLTSGPFPRDRELLIVTAHGVLLIGMILIGSASPHVPSSRVRPRAGVAGLIGGVTAAALATGGVVVLDGDQSRVDATTTAAVPPPPVPTDPTRVAWRWWDDSEGNASVVAAGAGVMVATDEGLYGLDGRTGEERWHYRRTDADPDALLAVDGGRSVVVSFDRRLLAFDAFTGELRWSSTPSSLLTEGELKFADRGSTLLYEMPWRTIVAIDAGTGTVQWEYSPATRLDCHWNRGIDVIADVVVIAGKDCIDDGDHGANGVIALNVATGQLLWQRASESVSVSYRGGTISESGNISVLDPRSGRRLAVPVSNAAGWAIGSGEIVFFALKPEGDRIQPIYPVTLAKAGEPAPRWQAALDMSPNSVAGVVALGDAVFILDMSRCSGGGIRVLDRDDGTERRQLDCDAVPISILDDSPPALVPAPGSLVVRSDGELVGLR